MFLMQGFKRASSLLRELNFNLDVQVSEHCVLIQNNLLMIFRINFHFSSYVFLCVIIEKYEKFKIIFKCPFFERRFIIPVPTKLTDQLILSKVNALLDRK